LNRFREKRIVPVVANWHEVKKGDAYVVQVRKGGEVKPLLSPKTWEVVLGDVITKSVERETIIDEYLQLTNSAGPVKIKIADYDGMDVSNHDYLHGHTHIIKFEDRGEGFIHATLTYRHIVNVDDARNKEFGKDLTLEVDLEVDIKTSDKFCRFSKPKYTENDKSTLATESQEHALKRRGDKAPNDEFWAEEAFKLRKLSLLNKNSAVCGHTDNIEKDKTEYKARFQSVEERYDEYRRVRVERELKKIGQLELMIKI